MVMGAMLGILPMKAQIGIRVAAVLVAAGAVAIAAFVLGFDRAELRALWRRFLGGLAFALHLALSVVGAVRARIAGARARRQQPPAEEPAPAPAGVFSRKKAAERRNTWNSRRNCPSPS